MMQACRAQSFHRDGENFGFGFGAIFEPEKLCARLIELRRAIRFGRLMPEDKSVVTKARRKLAVLRQMHPADRNGDIRAQAKFVALRIGERESAAPDFLPGTIEKDFGRLQNARLRLPIMMPSERLQDRVSLIFKLDQSSSVICREGGHYFRANILRTSATRFFLSTVFCASRLPTQ